MKRVLVTGGAGFVGVNLVRHLSSLGRYDVVVFDNETSGDRQHLPESATFLSGDLRDMNNVERAVDGIDAIVHLAADTRVMDSIEDPRHNFENNVLGSFNLLEAARKSGVGRVIAASTGGAILGDVEPPVHEEMVANPSAPYGASKLCLEAYLSAYSGSYGFSCAALRFSNLYGPRSFHKGSVVAHFYKQIMSGEPLVIYGDGTQVRDYLYSGDLNSVIGRAIDSDADGAFQLGSGRPTTINELLELIRKVTGRDFEVRYEDFRTGELRRTWCDIRKARAAFGFDPKTSLLDGLSQTWEWFQTQN